MFFEKEPMRYQSTTGLDPDRITELVSRVRQARAGQGKGVGRPAALGLYRQVELVLVLLRQNTTQAAAADLFGVSQPTVSRVYRALRPVLEQVTSRHQPAVPEVFARRVVIVDGTDVPTGNRALGRQNYSGKRHRQGLNVQIGADLGGMLRRCPTRCRARSTTVARSRAAAGNSRCTTVTGSPTPATGAPARSPRPSAPGGCELSEDRKADNATISALRSAVERAIAHWKNWKIVATGYRGRLTELPAVISTITKLEFYRLGW
ncbi:MAG TPA: transposase family protein [Sporichthyaceae bacterium]|nr:transposase family protein [Sporichthyaceae bacterium]